MSPFSRRKKDSEVPSTPRLAPVRILASSQVTQQSQFPTNSQSHFQSPRERRQPPVRPWSAHNLICGQWPSPHPRSCLTLSTSATVGGELFLFGGYVFRSDPPSNDLYVLSTKDFSTTLLQTSGDVPSPRFGHRAVLTGTTLLIWGGTSDYNAQGSDNYFYVLNLVSREWTCIVPLGQGPCGRLHHTMALVGSKIFVFGGLTGNRRWNDIWALDLSCLKSNPSWESYDPATGDEKPLPRSGHVSVTTGDRIVIFGGYDGTDSFNDTWSFNILTRKWTELQCTGSIPSPRAGNAAVLVDDIMYVFGGLADDMTYLDDLTALNLSTHRWIAFQDIGPGPSGRSGHAMACDGTRIFLFGGELSPGVQADKTKPIHVLDTDRLEYPKPHYAVKPSEETTQVTPQSQSSESLPTRGKLYRPSFSSDAHAAHSPSSFQKATLEELGHPSQQFAHELNRSLNDLQSLSTGARGRPRGPRRVPEEGQASNEYRAKLVVPGALSGKEIARSEDGRLVELELELLETVVAKTERDRRIGQLTDELALKSAQLVQVAKEKKRAGLELRQLQIKLDESLLSRDQAEANAAEEKKRAGLQLRELQAKLDESLLSRDNALEQAKENAAREEGRAGLKERELQAKLDELILSRDQALEQARENAAREEWHAHLKQRELRARLDEMILSRDHALKQAEANAAEANERAGLEQRELRAKLDELQTKLDGLTLSRDEVLRSPEQAQSALQKATSRVANADEPTCGHATEIAEVRAELEAKKSELAAVRLRLTDAEDGLAKNKAEEDKLRAQTAAGLVNTEVDRVMHKFMERMRAMETEISSLRGNEKSTEDMECSNE